MSSNTACAVFLSYRREETCHLAGRLADRLNERLGPTQVFMDVDTIEPGADFATAVAREVALCDVLIALIGPTWLTIADGQGRRRLDDPGDLVALEIRAALEREIHVIPVLVDGAAVLDRYNLPEGLQGLVLRNAVRLDHETFRSDVTTLLDSVERILLNSAQKATEPTDSTAVGTTDGANGKKHPDQAFDANDLGLQFFDQAARAAYQQAIDDGDAYLAREVTADAAIELGNRLATRGDIVGALAAYQRAIDSGNPRGSERAAGAAYRMGKRLAKRGDIAGAKAAFQWTVYSCDGNYASVAARSLRWLKFTSFIRRFWQRPSDRQ